MFQDVQADFFILNMFVYFVAIFYFQNGLL